MPVPKPTLRTPVHARTEVQKQRIFERRLARRARRVRKRRWLNAFLIFHICMVAVWLLPYQWPIVQALAPPGGGGIVRYYLIWTGFEQAWQMFSPNPDTRDLDVVAHVTYKDGHTRDWHFPQMRHLGDVTKYEKERMRKYLEISNYHTTLWEPMAIYAARQCDTIPGDPPTAVSLVRYARDLPPPGNALPPYTRMEFFRMPINPQEIR